MRKKPVFSALKGHSRPFSKEMARHLEAFRRILGKENVLITGLEAYNTDFLRTIRGVTKTVLRPKDALETSKVLKYCSQWGIPAVPQGGNTGLSGGNIAQDENEVILSTARMTTELKIDTDLPAVLTSAGNVLEVVTEACNKQGFTFPLDLGAKGSCQIGGNIATNAGGLRYLRYGSLHQNVLGLEIVLASGEILTDLDSMRKHNTGWDLKQIFIGSEGTLGVITRAAVLLYPLASSIQVCLFGCPSFSHVLSLYSSAKSRLGEILSAFEYYDSASHCLVLKHIPGTSDPFPTSYPYYVLIETSGSEEAHDREKLISFLESALEEKGLAGVLAQDEKERVRLWRLRETCAVAYVKEGPTHVYDFSLPIVHFEDTVQKATRLIGDKAMVVGLGHLGDANLHIGVVQNRGLLEKDFEPLLYELVQARRGSISAEHGIGSGKAQHLWRSKSRESIAVMVKCK